MSATVLVLGAKGRFGRAAVAAFGAAGWTVRALVRAGPDQPWPDVETVLGDALAPKDVVRAARSCDVIANAVNPPYRQWAKVVPGLTRSVIAAASETGATVMIPGNVYPYGAGMPTRLQESTPHRPTTPQGRVRTSLEAAYRSASEQGRIRAILLRGGDFIEGARTGNWFDGQVMAGLARGRMMYPGPHDLVHAWAYLPDMARAGVALADRRAGLAAYAEFGFAGYSLTGAELRAHAEAIIGRRLKMDSAPWPMIRLLGLVSGDLRAVAQMSYLWRTPHQIDGAHLAAAVPDFRDTPVREGLGNAIEALMRS
jgi:nucleoside-diphosphate-sugar epimerase